MQKNQKYKNIKKFKLVQLRFTLYNLIAQV